MKLEDQCVSLEYAKLLKELGVKQDSLFYYQNKPYNDGTDDIVIMINEDKASSLMNIDCDDDDHPKYAAFTSSELGKMLPFTIKLNEHIGMIFDHPKTFYLNANLGYTDHGYCPAIQYNFYLYDENDKYECDPTEMIVGIDFTDANEANNRAQMLIHLLENGYIKND